MTVEYRRTYRLTPDGYRSRYGLPPAESLAAPGIALAKAAEGRARYVADGGHAGLATAWARLAADAYGARLARVAELGFPGDLPGYLRDRHITRGLGVGPIAAELGASRRTVRRRLSEPEVPRQTSLTQATAVDARLARVAELGFPGDLPGHLRERCVTENGRRARRRRPHRDRRQPGHLRRCDRRLRSRLLAATAGDRAPGAATVAER